MSSDYVYNETTGRCEEQKTKASSVAKTALGIGIAGLSLGALNSGLLGGNRCGGGLFGGNGNNGGC